MGEFFDAQEKILNELEALSGADRLDYLANLARQDMSTAPEGAARWQIVHVVNSAITSALVNHSLRLLATITNLTQAGDFD